MNKPKYLRWIFLSLGVGALSGFLSRKGTEYYNLYVTKPSFSPPDWLFPVAWGILYVLMGIGAARVAAAPKSRERSRGLNLFVVQLVVNFFWSLIFFLARAYGAAFLWLLLLLVLVAAMLLSFRKTDKTAAYLQIPYLLWLCFAGVLNWAVWQLNR